MTPEQLMQAILQAFADLKKENRLSGGELPSEVVVERPKNREHGDWSTNVAMQFAGEFKLKPRELAELVAEKLGRNPLGSSGRFTCSDFANPRCRSCAGILLQ